MTSAHFLPNLVSHWDLTRLASAKQRNQEINVDGFGIAWYNLDIDPEPAIFTSITPPMHNLNLHRIAPKVLTELIFTHVRAASPGSAIVETNTHPFGFGKYVFMHNGGVANFGCLRRQLCLQFLPKIHSFIKGTTDSEYAGALFVQSLPRSDLKRQATAEELRDAMVHTLATLTRLAHEFGLQDRCTPSSLNFAVSDGKYVVATRFRDHPTVRAEDPPSLYYCRVKKMSLVNGETIIEHCTECEQPTAIVISSEPLTFDYQWILIPKNHIIIVDPMKNVTVELVRGSDVMCHRKFANHWLRVTRIRTRARKGLSVSCSDTCSMGGKSN